MNQPGAPGERPEASGPRYPYPQQPHQPGFPYPQWQPPVPPKKTSPAAVVLIIGSVVVVILMALAFLAWGYPGFLREPDAKGAIGTAPARVRVPGDRAIRVPRRRCRAAAGPRCRSGRSPWPTR